MHPALNECTSDCMISVVNFVGSSTCSGSLVFVVEINVEAIDSPKPVSGMTQVLEKKTLKP